MRLSLICWRIFLALLVPAVLSTVLLYLYPAVLGCNFPQSGLQDNKRILDNVLTTSQHTSPFRLLVLADPQLEGDTSLPDPNAAVFPSLKRLSDGNSTTFTTELLAVLKDTIVELFTSDVPLLIAATRKRLDLLGNDYYLAHIYRTLHWWTQPTHVTVLGDLLGSQWLTEPEFEWRGWRFWHRVFAGGQRVEDNIMDDTARHEVLGADQRWAQRIINVAGNHDVGYAGDLSEHRLERFERVFGKANWDINFTLSPAVTNDSTIPPPAIRLVILNDMNLDGPVLSSVLQNDAYTEINDRIISHSRPVTDRTTFTILLTHIPLEKAAGVCVDAPYFSYWPDSDASDLQYENVKPGGLREQNHLSMESSRNVLEGMFGMTGKLGVEAGGRGRKGLILTGHDHEGCDVVHYLPPSPSPSLSSGGGGDTEEEDKRIAWQAARTSNFPAHFVRQSVEDVAAEGNVPTIREITLRSMMGSYGGNAGMLSVWFDERIGEWDYAFSTCMLGVQHWWWAVHVLDAVLLGVSIVGGVARIIASFGARPEDCVQGGERSKPVQRSEGTRKNAKGKVKKS